MLERPIVGLTSVGLAVVVAKVEVRGDSWSAAADDSGSGKVVPNLSENGLAAAIDLLGENDCMAPRL